MGSLTSMNDGNTTIGMTGSCLICELPIKLGPVFLCTDHSWISEGGVSPVAIQTHPSKGRILVSTSDLDEGTLLFRERPFYYGPSKDSTDICLICLKTTESKCIKCGYPACSKVCSEFHQTSEECAIMRRDSPADNLSAVLPLRCLLSKGSPEWNYLLEFEDHQKARFQIPGEKSKVYESVVKQIIEKWELSEFSAKEIFKVEGILFINSLECLPAEFDGRLFQNSIAAGGGRGFYPITSLASHDCINVAFRSRKETSTDAIAVTETRCKNTLKKGEEITLHYSSGFKGREERREALRKGWFFDCRCDRCISPDELGSHLSTLICTKCGGNSTSLSEIYECERCYEKDSSANACRQNLTSELEETCEKDVDHLMNLLERYEKRFHPRHYLILLIKWLLINQIGHKEGYLYSQISRDLLNLKIKICEDYMTALNIIDRGISHNSAITLWELFTVKNYKFQKEYADKTTSKDSFAKGLKDCLRILRSAKKAARFAENNSVEFKIGVLSEKAIYNIKEVLEFIDLV